MRSVVLILALLAPLTASADGWSTYHKKPDDWFKTAEAKAVAANVLAWQTPRGDWPNDTHTFAPRPKDAPDKPGTFDDGHTAHETRYLVRMFNATGDATYRDAALKAIDQIIAAQYANGGFPQRYPPGEKYPRYITFNDRTMVNLLELMRDVSKDPAFDFAGPDRKLVGGRMVDAGIRCILALQHQGRHGLTAWAAQYDEETLAPRPARAFEPASLASAESADVLLFLMSLDQPGPEVVASVRTGVEWFRRVELHGLRVTRTKDDVTVAADPSAPPVWARFYDLNTLRPVFAGRDGVVKRSLAEIEQERRTGYAWYGDWGEKVFKTYEKWPYRAGE